MLNKCIFPGYYLVSKHLNQNWLVSQKWGMLLRYDTVISFEKKLSLRSGNLEKKRIVAFHPYNFKIELTLYWLLISNVYIRSGGTVGVLGDICSPSSDFGRSLKPIPIGGGRLSPPLLLLVPLPLIFRPSASFSYWEKDIIWWRMYKIINSHTLLVFPNSSENLRKA